MSAPPAPASSAFLLGHGPAEAAWLRARDSGRLPHAWLLTGPRGVGKAALAYRLARHLLAEPAEAATCQDPASRIFRIVAQQAHPDLHVLTRPVDPRTGRLKAEIPVDAVREVTEAMYRTAARPGARALLVDAADDLNRNAANALLKLLEEPPSGAVFLLVCQRPGRLPRTIASRCARLALRPLPAPLVVEGLRRLALDIAEPRARKLAELAHGSIGRALELEAIDWPGLYGSLLGELGGGPSRALAAAETLLRIAGEGGIVVAARLLGEIVRRAARLAAGRPPELVLVEGEMALLRGLAGAASLDRCVALWEKLAASAAETEALNLDPLQSLLGLVHELVAPPAGPLAAPVP